MTKIEKGVKVFVFQPQTSVCRAHWIETEIIKVWKEEETTVFLVDTDISLPGGDSLGWGEWNEKDQGKAWDFSPGTLSFEEQTKLLMEIFE